MSSKLPSQLPIFLLFGYPLLRGKTSVTSQNRKLLAQQPSNNNKNNNNADNNDKLTRHVPMLLTKCRVTIKAPKKKKKEATFLARLSMCSMFASFPVAKLILFLFFCFILFWLLERNRCARSTWLARTMGRELARIGTRTRHWLRLVSRRVPQRAAPSPVPPSSSLCLFQRRRRCRLVALSSLSRRVAESQNNRAIKKKVEKKI